MAAELMAAMYDASLDEFAANNFALNPYHSRYSYRYYGGESFSSSQANAYAENWNEYFYADPRTYDALNWWGFGGYGGRYRRFSSNIRSTATGETMYNYAAERTELEEVALADEWGAGDQSKPPMDGTMSISANQQQRADGKFKAESDKTNLSQVKARTNLNETAFFYPQMETNSKGEIVLKFTTPESLTRWKFLGLAHTKDLKIGTIQEEVVTQKELMVMPNAPRFFREGDQMTFTAKVSNLSETDLDLSLIHI